MAGKQPQLTIVIPAFGEERRIGATLDALASFLRRDGFFRVMQVEVLVVVADAGDATAKIAAGKAKLFKRFKVLRPGARVGKGRDVQFGMLRAKGRFVLFMDADLATPLHHVREFYEACQQADIVIGTRDLLTYRNNAAYGLFAALGNSVYRITGGLQVEDTQCGFKMFTAAATKLCFSKLTILDWGFDLELLAIARANNLKVVALRIEDWQDAPHGTHNESVSGIMWRTAAQHLYILSARLWGRYK